MISLSETSSTDDSARTTPPVASSVASVAFHARATPSYEIVFATVLAASVPGAFVNVQSCAELS